MRYYWDLLYHFFRANSRHGTHSPFVYKLADEVIYAKVLPSSLPAGMPEGFAPGYQALLQNCLGFLGLDALSLYPTNHLQKAVCLNLNLVEQRQVLDLLRLGHIVVVDEPYRTQKTKTVWQDLCQDSAVLVSIDLFHFGILLNRDEQRKEYFRLRYPYRRWPLGRS